MRPLPEAVSFVPLLPEEGIKHNVGGEGLRGGLLCEDKKGDNVLEFFSSYNNDGGEVADLRYLDAIKNSSGYGSIQERGHRSILFTVRFLLRVPE